MDLLARAIITPTKIILTFRRLPRNLNAAPGVPCLSDSSDKSRSVYLRAAFMTAFVVYPEAIIRARL